MKIILISRILVFLSGFFVSAAVYAEVPGININYNEFNLRIEFNDNAEDRITGMEYVREPSGMLFDMVYLIQSNAKRAAKLESDLLVKLGNNAGSVLINRNKPEYRRIKYEKNLKKLDADMLYRVICREITGKECVRPAKNATTWFYVSDTLLMPVETDLIDFGCLPCENIKRYTLTKRFDPAKENSYPPRFKKVTVDRVSIYHYFNKLLNF